MDETMREENSFSYRAEAWQCHGCAAAHRAAAKMARGKENPLASTRFLVRHRNGV